ncbi:MAG: DUF5107 domain-containing protein [Verrucomicrobia bacterium]|nr:DUF5107 domain-containing protein [Verrucomicrobiota bacterium]
MNSVLFRRLRLCGLCVLTAAIAVAVQSAHASSAPVRAWRGQIELPTYPWSGVTHPYFRGTDRLNIYPYPMLDFLSRDRTNRAYRTVVLENDCLRITFLPDLGGRVHEVIDKTTGQPMFYVNHVIKPALIGQCGAWISGGIEWNTGPQGHTVGCMQPVDFVILPPAKDGSQSVAIGETERIYGTKWTVVVTLRPGRSFIEERIRMYNPTDSIRPYYFWNCTAVLNTKGFRFIYPMTLGTDHGAERFFNWPIHEGKDLTRGTNYQDAASIFAWECDKDFFGSYNDDLDRGVVACANHHVLPGKKAWTWGWGGYGTMHQADLTDTDGPYNEVQTGPLTTQADVGRLDPCEAISWQEWWYPIHGIGGFDFANTNLAASVKLENGRLVLKMLGTGEWPNALVRVSDDRQVLLNQIARIDQKRPADVTADIKDAKRLLIRITTDGTTLAEWVFPLDLPARTPPPRKKAAETPAELVVSAWQHFLLARFDDAERDFKKALEKDPQCYDALVGLANIEMDRAPARAADYARAAIAVDPNSGRAQYALAAAEHRLDLEGRSPDDAKQHFKTALDAAWKATCDPLTAIPARALVARLLIRDSKVAEAAQVLGEPGPWQADPVCRGLLAYCLSARVAGNGTKTKLSDSLARQNLEVDPLDLFSRLVLALNKDTEPIVSFVVPEGTDRKSVVNLIAQVRDIGGRAILSSLAIDGMSEDGRERTASESPARGPKRRQNSVSVMDRYDALMAEDWPWRYTDLPELYAKYNANSRDGKLALSLGHLLFHLGRHDAAREMWKKADELGVEPAIANRALGMAALTLDNNLDSALMYLTKAHEADPKDAIIARDLSRVLHRIADASDSPERKKEAWQRARDSLQSAFEQGKGRSDFVALLARSLMRLGDYPATAKLLDSVRITIWEGAREAHDLFEEAHLALGEEHLQAGRAAEALAEFNRALEYPANLATGRLENAREAHIHYLRGKALAALGKRDEAIAAWKLAAEEPPSGDPKKERARENARKELDALH